MVIFYLIQRLTNVESNQKLAVTSGAVDVVGVKFNNPQHIQQMPHTLQKKGLKNGEKITLSAHFDRWAESVSIMSTIKPIYGDRVSQECITHIDIFTNVGFVWQWGMDFWLGPLFSYHFWTEWKVSKMNGEDEKWSTSALSLFLLSGQLYYVWLFLYKSTCLHERQNRNWASYRYAQFWKEHVCSIITSRRDSSLSYYLEKRV